MFIDFRRQPLIPYKVFESGPAVAVGDLNADGKMISFLEVPSMQLQRFIFKPKKDLNFKK